VACRMTRPSASAVLPIIIAAVPRTHRSSGRPDGGGRSGWERPLADADCGLGVLTVRLAYLFGQAVGLDPDAGMLAAGCRAAEEKQS
jgi:hypothetical protein